jgi:hypothetical protein
MKSEDVGLLQKEEVKKDLNSVSVLTITPNMRMELSDCPVLSQHSNKSK